MESRRTSECSRAHHAYLLPKEQEVSASGKLHEKDLPEMKPSHSAAMSYHTDLDSFALRLAHGTTNSPALTGELSK